jgi:enoyl-CoA hydratase/carnithine racemase
MNEAKVLIEQKGNVLLIGLNRADKYNAADMELLEQLSLAYGKLDSDPKLRVGLVYAVGDHFTEEKVVFFSQED